MNSVAVNSVRSNEVDLAAVVVVPQNRNSCATDEAEPLSTPVAGTPIAPSSSWLTILGNELLVSWMELLRKLRLESLWLTSQPIQEKPATAAMAVIARQGIERLLVIELKSYAEMDLNEFLRFHRDHRNLVTEAQDDRGQLGVRLLDRLALGPDAARGEFLLTSKEKNGQHYQFRGYAKRVLSAPERQKLAADALTGGCALRPFGREIGEQVWAGENVTLAKSARVVGPSFIGARTVINAGATVGPYAVVEHDCVVDCGTTLERATILPSTYLAPGLFIRDALVDGWRLEDLRDGASADLRPAGLGNRIGSATGRRAPVPPFANASSGASSPASSTMSSNRSSDLTSSPAASQQWRQVQL